MIMMNRLCVVCGSVVSSTDLRITRCEEHRGKRPSRVWIRKEIRCKICNDIIPIGSRRTQYCSNECHRVAIRNADNYRSLLKKKQKRIDELKHIEEELNERASKKTK